MRYSRSLLKGESGPIRKALAQQLHIKLHHKKSHKKHAIERRRHHMAKPKLGSGGRFAAFKRRLEGEGKSPEAAGAIAASAERKKYGDSKMAKLSAIGRRQAQSAE